MLPGAAAIITAMGRLLRPCARRHGNGPPGGDGQANTARSSAAAGLWRQRFADGACDPFAGALACVSGGSKFKNFHATGPTPYGDSPGRHDVASAVNGHGDDGHIGARRGGESAP